VEENLEIRDIKNWHNTQQKLHNMIMVEYAITEQKVVSLGLDTSNIDTSVEQEERPAHHEPLIPTQEELDAEHVGPTEMYLGDVEVMRPKTDIQSRIEAINAAEEVEEEIEVVAEVEEEDLDENEDLVSITNVAVQLGYKAIDVKVFFKARFDETIGLSANLKAFRMWADTGKKPFAETVKEAPIVLPVVPQEVQVEQEDFNEACDNEDDFIETAEAIEEVETVEEVVETIEEVPAVKEVKEKLPESPLNKLDLFIERCSEKGYSTELLDFYTKEHFDSTDSLEDNIEAFVKWAPVPAIVKEAKAKTVIKETPVEAVVEKVEADSIEKVIQKKTAEQENMVQVAKSLFDAPTETIVEKEIPVEVEEVVEEQTMTDVLDMSPLPVEIIEPTRPTEDEAIENLFSMEDESEEEEDIFDISGGLEASEELLAEAKVIEERMILLYGSVRNYHTEEVKGYINVIIDESLERFAVKQ
jgi:hypothetical protein